MIKKLIPLVFLLLGAWTHGQSVAFNYNVKTDGGAACVQSVSEDAGAFDAFHTAALAFQSTHPGQLIQLTIPYGSYCTLATSVGSSKNFTAGISNLVIVGYGATISDGGGQGFFLGGGSFAGISQVTANAFALVNTVSAGASCVTAITPANASKWAVGDYATLTGGDLQGSGSFPPNPYVWEYVKVTSVHTGTGQVCFSAPLVHSYKSTWPSYTTGITPYNGGPATLYAYDNQFWNTSQEYRGLTMSEATQIQSIGRDIRFTDVTFSNVSAIPTQNGSFICTRCTFTQSIEVDKIIGTYALINSTAGLVEFQSASVENFVVTGSTITTLNGTGKLNNISGSSRITNFRPGSGFFGASGEVIVSNSVITNIANNGGAAGPDATRRGVMSAGVLAVPKNLSFASASNDGTGQVQIAVADSSPYTAGLTVILTANPGQPSSCTGDFQITVPDATHIVLVGSTFTATCSGNIGNNPLPWASPGANLYTRKSYHFSASGFQITDITQDANQTYYSTSLAGGFPVTPNGNTPPIIIRVHPAPKFTCTNCTGSVDAVDLSNPGATGQPLWSYSKRTITAANNSSAVVPVWGTLVTANVTVNAASNAAGAMAFTFDAPNPFVETSSGTNAFWTTSVNAKQASATSRVFTPTTTANPQAGDSLVAPGAGTWILDDQISDQLSSVPAGGDPVSVTVEIITNQGVVYP